MSSQNDPTRCVLCIGTFFFGCRDPVFNIATVAQAMPKAVLEDVCVHIHVCAHVLLVWSSSRPWAQLARAQQASLQDGTDVALIMH